MNKYVKNCIFCKIIKKEVESKKIFENKNILSILDISQKPKGHILLMPKKHYKNFFCTPKKIIKEIFNVTKIIGNNLLKIGVKGINIKINNGKIAGQTIMHFHVHLIPKKFNNKYFNKKIKINNNDEIIINNIKKFLN